MPSRCQSRRQLAARRVAVVVLGVARLFLVDVTWREQPCGHGLPEHVESSTERPELKALVEQLAVFIDRVGRRVVGHHLAQREPGVGEEEELVASPRIAPPLLALLANSRKEGRLERRG